MKRYVDSIETEKDVPLEKMCLYFVTEDMKGAREAVPTVYPDFCSPSCTSTFPSPVSSKNLLIT